MPKIYKHPIVHRADVKATFYNCGPLPDRQVNSYFCGLMQIWRRTSIITTVWNYCYDHLLCDILNPGDAFIDFIAVSEQARYAENELSMQTACMAIAITGKYS